MIKPCPLLAAPLDQGDILADWPIVTVALFRVEALDSVDVANHLHRVIVLAQTCDLENQKALRIQLAIVHDATSLVAAGLIKTSDLKGTIRPGRVFGWSFYPEYEVLGLHEMVLGLRNLHTLPRHRRQATPSAPTSVSRTPRQALRRYVSRIGLPKPDSTLD